MIHRSLLLALATLGAAAPVRAADMDMLLSAPELTIAQTRTGPYLRADLFYDFASDLDTGRRLAAPSGSAGLPGGDGTLEDAGGFALGLGYQFTDMLRADLTLRYAEPEFQSGPVFLPGCGALCAGRETADVREWELLANGYVDLGTIGGFTPYLGGSIGAVHTGFDAAALTLCGAAACGVVAGSGEDEWRFAFGGSAGVAYDVTEAVSLDVGYRYLNVDGGADSRFEVAGLPGATLAGDSDGYDRHSLRVGLRYKLW